MKLFKRESLKFLKSLKSLQSLQSLNSLKSLKWFRSKPKIDHEQERQEKLQEIGSKLHQVRTEKEIELEKVAQITHIQVRLLKAIEEGNLEVLPEPVYIREFLRQFANALGLNGTELASQFPTYSSPTISQAKLVWLRLPGLELRPIHLYIFYVLLVFFAVEGLSNQLEEEAVENWLTKTQQQEVAQPPSETKPAKPKNLPSQPQVKSTSPTKQDSAQQVVVDIQLKDDCWLKVVVDGKTDFEGTLTKGTHRTWMANEKLTVKAGNAGGVFVAVNEEKAKQLGKPGQIQEVTFKVTPQS